jgi:predicted GNAT family N-acyltransferase
MADRRGVGLLDAYRQYVGDPFASMVGGAARGYLGLDKPTYANEEAYRTAQALGNMPVIGGPAGVIKAAMNAPDALVAMGGLLGKVGAGGKVRRGEAIADALREKYPDVKLDLSGDDRLYLGRIVVPKDKRGQGVGSSVMSDLVKRADEAGVPVDLSPSSDFGGSVGRLKDFYKRFGFVENKGRNKDFSISESMYRQPVASQAVVRAPRAPQDDALETARRNAVSMLGLPESNTAMDRAKALGFDVNSELYHATSKDFANPKISASGKLGPGFYLARSPQYAEKYGGDNPQIMPVYTRGKFAQSDVRDDVAESIRQRMYDENPNFSVKDWKIKTAEDLMDFGYAGTDIGFERAVTVPSNVRSRFAAFDPARVNENDLLGNADPRLLALIAAGTGGGLLGYNYLGSNQGK